MIAALYVCRQGPYWGRPDVDAYDLSRNAMSFSGASAVVAHPPCSTWCALARVNQARYGHSVGADGGTFRHALAVVRSNRGVLEHPAGSLAWGAFGLQKPARGSWQGTPTDGWVTEVSQVAYGHKARKRTWLYCVSRAKPADLDWSEPEATHQISSDRRPNQKPVLSKTEAILTPVRFAECLLALARECS